ncbi:MAG: hypothetical protein ACI87W_000768 [Halieaceae bacterium]|jgi:hypothetical protein
MRGHPDVELTPMLLRLRYDSRVDPHRRRFPAVLLLASGLAAERRSVIRPLWMFIAAALGLALLAPPPALANESEAEIEYLLSAIGNSGCTFIRNGSSHSPENAEAHLRKKYERGRKYASTAEKFIERLATASSWSKKPYTMRCVDEEATPTGDWLRRKLLNYRQTPLNSKGLINPVTGSGGPGNTGLADQAQTGLLPGSTLRNHPASRC